MLDAVALLGDDVLAQAASALGRNAAGLDDRLDVGAGKIGQLLGDLLALAGELLAALAGVGKQGLERRERGDGLKAERVGVGLGHGFDPLLGRTGNSAGGGFGLAARSLAALRDDLLLGRRLALGPASDGGALALGDLGALVDNRLRGVSHGLGDLGGSLSGFDFNSHVVSHR
jgi:hypothetical protein